MLIARNLSTSTWGYAAASRSHISCSCKRRPSGVLGRYTLTIFPALSMSSSTRSDFVMTTSASCSVRESCSIYFISSINPGSEEFTRKMHISTYCRYSLTISSIFLLSPCFDKAPVPGESNHRRPLNVKYWISPVVSVTPSLNQYRPSTFSISPVFRPFSCVANSVGGRCL